MAAWQRSWRPDWPPPVFCGLSNCRCAMRPFAGGSGAMRSSWLPYSWTSDPLRREGPALAEETARPAGGSDPGSGRHRTCRGHPAAQVREGDEDLGRSLRCCLPSSPPRETTGASGSCPRRLRGTGPLSVTSASTSTGTEPVRRSLPRKSLLSALGRSARGGRTPLATEWPVPIGAGTRAGFRSGRRIPRVSAAKVLERSGRFPCASWPARFWGERRGHRGSRRLARIPCVGFQIPGFSCRPRPRSRSSKGISGALPPLVVGGAYRHSGAVGPGAAPQGLRDTWSLQRGCNAPDPFLVLWFLLGRVQVPVISMAGRGSWSSDGRS